MEERDKEFVDRKRLETGMKSRMERF